MVHITFCSHSQPPYEGLVIRPVRMVMQHGPPAMEKGTQVCVHRYFPFSSTEFSLTCGYFQRSLRVQQTFFFFLLAFFKFTIVPQVTDDHID